MEEKSLPVAVSAGLVEDDSLPKQTSVSHHRPEVRLIFKAIEFAKAIYKQTQKRYRIVQYKDRYCAQVKRFGFWYWIDNDQSLVERFRYSSWSQCINLNHAREQIEAHKEKHKKHKLKVVEHI